MICIHSSENSEQTTSLRRLPLIEEESSHSSERVEAFQSSESDQLRLESLCLLQNLEIENIRNSQNSNAPEFHELDLSLNQSESCTPPPVESNLSVHSGVSNPQINVLPKLDENSSFYRWSHLMIC